MSSFEKNPNGPEFQLPGANWFSASWSALALISFSILFATGYVFNF
jgi:hypothetical protein